MKKAVLFSLLLCFILTSSCANKAQTGAAGGAASGAVIGQAIGGNTEATVAMALLGTLVGYLIGNEMDKADEEKLAEALDTTLAGETKEWVNPDSNNQYKVTPGKTYTSSNRVCRTAEIDAVIDGKVEKTTSTACKNANGEWVLQT